MKVDRFVWTSSVNPRETLSANDEINDMLLHISERGCGLRGPHNRVCEDFSCSSILKVIELLTP